MPAHLAVIRQIRIHTKGFTLIELLVVISILAILSVIGFVAFGNVQKGARDAKRKADIDAISKAWEVSYNHNLSTPYPALSATMFSSGSIPRDPLVNSTYNYVSGANEGSGGSSYRVCTDLEGDGFGSTADTDVLDYCISSQQ